ncbi:demethylmenaquinone methyltransferase [Rhizocola hellebori]|uniref:Demethylmenaquinone methyltransferase n=1 Tax=Rhizocola hellebori TaxID=1392758 RepID=A0A8J3QFJ1_9ACTN|nr:demethylmenaquinone methyltransferase [Rhizocola hellebori]GIH09989.1 demethylmenaquinone methyltransferase [Rhizocola hellebori]
MTRADLDKEPHEIAAMFDGVAEKYDRTNTVLSFGQDKAWRRSTRAALGLQAGEKVLDLGAGTGVSTEELTRSGAYVVGVDISLGMLAVGRRTRPTVPLVAGDALALPFPDQTFDAVTTSFVIRNVANTPAALRELARVTKPGGRLVICEFSHPTNTGFRKVYLQYLMRSLPAVAKRVSSNPDAYVYLAESIRQWPDQKEFAAIIGENNWTKVGWRNLTGGVVALHRATK